MGTISLTLPTIGQPNSTEDVKIPNALTTFQTDYNGNVDENNLKAAVLEKVGVSSSVIRRGKMVQASAEATSATTYAVGNLTTPDRVSNVVLQTDGLIVVAYQALWQDSVINNGRAAVFIGANQLQIGSTSGGPSVQETQSGSTINDYDIISSTALGLIGNSGAGIASEVTTGQIVTSNTSSGGGPIYIFAAAGTYDISVQYKNNIAGTVTVKNRHLWVWTMAF